MRNRYGNNADQEIQKLKDEHKMIMNEIDLGIMKIQSQNNEIYNSSNYKNMLASTQSRIEDELQ